MESLTNTFVPKYSPHLNNVSSLHKHNTPCKTTTISNSFFTTFQHTKKLIAQKETPLTLKHPHLEEIVERSRKTTKPLLPIIFKQLDELICTYLDTPLHHSVDPKQVLSGFFVPTNELPPTECRLVEGSLPACLEGAYIRNGPNPQFEPEGPYHLFDGDGMLHMIKISNGRATFCSRYVRTYKYVMEHEIGYSFFPSIFSSFNGLAATMARCMLNFTRVVTGQFDPVYHGFGTANTGLALFSGHLYALCESDLPYAVKVTSDGDIITLGRQDFDSSKPFFRMTAHPKVDQETGEAFAFRYNIMRPFLTYFRINSSGIKQPEVSISSTQKLSVIHDFAITRNYAIFPETQIVVNPTEIVKGKPPVRVDLDMVPRLGIIPRYADDESKMVWIDTPELNLMHLVNAWEEGDNTIAMVASNITAVDQVLQNIDLAQLSLEKITVNVNTRTVQRQPLSSKFLDMAVINPAYATKKNRYIYAAVIATPMRGAGVVKLDLSKCEADQSDYVVASRLYGPQCCGSEPFFVPREPNNPKSAEDDGYLVAYVHDNDTNKSDFVVMDAKSTSLDIVACVKLPNRVPCGFHGLFVSQSELNKL